jgi:uncharacterized RDD family membrane protein YckC
MAPERAVLPLAWSQREGLGMDTTDLNNVPEPQRKPFGSNPAPNLGFNPAPRLDFVPPPEVPTPEYASVRDRAKALAIDALVWVGAVLLLGVLFDGISSSNGLLWIKIGGPPSLFATVLWLVYMTLTEAKYGASWGKRARGLRVLMEDGAPVTHEAALIRNLLRFLDAIPYIVPYYLGYYVASRSRKVQRYGDQVAETIVVSASGSREPAVADLPPALPLLDSDPATVPSKRRGRRLLAVIALLVVLAGGAAAAFLLMR